MKRATMLASERTLESDKEGGVHKQGKEFVEVAAGFEEAGLRRPQLAVAVEQS